MWHEGQVESAHATCPPARRLPGQAGREKAPLMCTLFGRELALTPGALQSVAAPQGEEG